MRAFVVAAACAGLAAGLVLVAPAQTPTWPYQWVPNWPSSPRAEMPGYMKGEGTGVAVDDDGTVYYCQGAWLSPVYVFDRNGKYLRGWGARTLRLPHTVRIDPEGNLWFTDLTTHLLLKFTPEGTLLGTYGVRNVEGSDTQHFNMPTDVAFGPNGDVYVADGYGNNRIVRLSKDLRYLGQWGKAGRGPGQFRLPHSIVIDKGLVYVADRGNLRIQVFKLDGTYVREWRVGQTPYGLCIKNGKMYVVTGYACTVHIYTLQGQLLARFGEPVERGRPKGQLAAPHMVCVDDEGALYTAELNGHRVQKWIPRR